MFYARIKIERERDREERSRREKKNANPTCIHKTKRMIKSNMENDALCEEPRPVQQNMK